MAELEVSEPRDEDLLHKIARLVASHSYTANEYGINEALVEEFTEDKSVAALEQWIRSQCCEIDPLWHYDEVTRRMYREPAPD